MPLKSTNEPQSTVLRDVEGQQLPGAQDMEWASDLLDRVVGNVCKAVIGKESAVMSVLTALCARGHVLLEDHPGVGKTLIARSFARSLSVDVGRVQYTPDVVPSDVTGSVIFSRREEDFKFRPGPVFTNILLADEVNRGTPRTQSSLLEAMEELAVTVDDVRYELPVPFFVIATQNPLELHGTFPLPESQLDRFMMRISVGYPNRASEDRIIQTYCKEDPVAHLKPVATRDDMIRLLDVVSSVYIGNNARAYLLNLVQEIRTDSRVRMGVSPRASISLARASQARALINGRDSVLPEDIKTLAVPVLAHRIVPHSHSDNPSAMLQEYLDRVPISVAE
mgnify:CR=1 FL=1